MSKPGVKTGSQDGESRRGNLTPSSYQEVNTEDGLCFLSCLNHFFTDNGGSNAFFRSIQQY
jgi:hypothetical protein